MPQLESIRHNASLQVLEQVNYASMHCALLLSESGSLRCTALSENHLDVSGQQYSAKEFAALVSEMKNPVVYGASTPEYQSALTSFIQAAKQTPHLIGDSIRLVTENQVEGNQSLRSHAMLKR